jgi:NADH:ubiquinone oxidoreductase subunit F (NADH-binding)
VNNSSTLVQNVESLAQVALIARYGLDWYRQAGQRGASGTVLLSVSGAVKSSGVIEVEAGSSVREAVEMVGGHQDRTRAVLLGGYFGSWIEGKAAMNLPLDAALLHDQGLSLGCGVIAVLGAEGCGVCETAKVMRYLANESAAQCGPCFFGLRALAEACERVASRGATTGDREQLERWVKAVRGRGACRHPDGASVFLLSALTTFASEFTHHPAHWSQRGE